MSQTNESACSEVKIEIKAWLRLAVEAGKEGGEGKP